MQELDFLRIQRESQKFLEIDNIFNRLASNFVEKIFALFKEIFQQEHAYTIQELLKLAIQKEIPLKDFKLAEHYKLNSNIFKANLQMIVNVVIDDIWSAYNKQIVLDEKSIAEPRQLTQIDEESAIEQCQSLSETSFIKDKKDVEIQKQVQSARSPLAKLLAGDKSPQFISIASSPRHSRDNSQNMPIKQQKQVIQNSKKKNSSLIKNKSMDLKNLVTEGILQPKSTNRQQLSLKNVRIKREFKMILQFINTKQIFLHKIIMDQDLNENLIKLSQLLRQQNVKKPTYNPSKYSNLHLMLARSVSISTESSSRMIQMKTNFNTQNTSKAQLNKQQKYFVSRRMSLAKQLKTCDSYLQKRKIESQFIKTDNLCGLKKVFEIGKTIL
ncbi:unnamed protein product [Paramecium pentaurelia]|uniref:Uncharacterized protein n=1 Tax=Paramecium pentaurelia TaxID=43138 RepID=A0A8S1S995_9CILI|nr:unnamed protein product [Paramecium pentaurelia]